jgi:hypothetical protein
VLDLIDAGRGPRFVGVAGTMEEAY